MKHTVKKLGSLLWLLIIAFSCWGAHAQITLTSDVTPQEGTVMVALYTGSGRMLKVQTYPADSALTMDLNVPKSCAYAKIYWWLGGTQLAPMCADLGLHFGGEENPVIHGVVTGTFLQGGHTQTPTITISGLSKEDALQVNGNETATSITVPALTTDTEQYLGYRVEATLEQEYGAWKLAYIEPWGNINTVTTVSLSDLYDVYESDLNRANGYATIEYDNNGKTASVQVDLAAKFYVNMDKEALYSDEIVSFFNYFNIKNGTITFIRNEASDPYADYVLIEYFNNASYVITGINAGNHKISYEYMDGSTVIKTGSEFIDPDDEDAWVFFFKNNAPIGFDDLKVGDVLSKITNSSKTVVKVYVSDEKVEGMIESVISRDATAQQKAKYVVTIAGTKYNFAKGILTSASIGSSGLAYFSCSGTIVFFRAKPDITADDFALFFSAVMEDDKWGTSTIVSMHVLNISGGWADYEFADRVSIKYGDEEYHTADINDFISKCAAKTNGMIAFNNNDKFDGHVNIIQYKLNTSGKVSTLVIPKYEEQATDNYLSGVDFENLRYDAENGRLGNAVYVPDNAIVFTYNGNSMYDENSFDVSSVSRLFSDEDEYMGGYYISKDGNTDEPDCFIVLSEGSRVKTNTRLMVVSDTYERVNKDGDAQATISGYMNGMEEEQVFFVADDYRMGWNEYADLSISGPQKSYEYDDLGEGDVIAVAFNADDEIGDIQIVMLADDVRNGTVSAFYETYENKNKKDVEFMYGYVADSAFSQSGVKYFDLSNYFDNNYYEVDDIKMIARVRENRLTGNVYYVDLSKKSVSIEVESSFDNVQANNARIKNGTTVKGGEGYFMYTQTFKGDIIDAVVFIVDCAHYQN